MALFSMWTDEDEADAIRRSIHREETRKASGFVPWWELLSSDSGEAADLVRKRKMTTINVYNDAPINDGSISIVDYLATALVERDQNLQPWTLAQIRKVKVEEYWHARGWWYLAFTSTEDAVLARLLLGEVIYDR